MRKVQKILFVLVILVVLTSCGKQQVDKDAISNTNSSNPTTLASSKADQYYLGNSDLRVIAEGSDVAYYIRACNHGNYLYYLDKQSLASAPLCSKPNCLHDRELDDFKRTTCGAYVFDPSNLIAYDGKLYLVCTEVNDKDALYQTVLNAYSADGTFLKREAILPSGGPYIMHEGFLYYICYAQKEEQSGYALNRYSMSDKKTEIIRFYPEDQMFVSNLMAYENYLYVIQTKILANSLQTTLGIYKIDDNTWSELQSTDPGGSIETPFIDNGKLFFHQFRYTENGEIDRKFCQDVYMTELDGTNIQLIGAVEEPCGIICVFDGYILTSNRIDMDYEYDGQIGQFVSIGPPERYTLYHDFEPVCSFTLDDVSGIDFSIHEMSHVCHMGDYVLFQSYSMAQMGGDCGWIAMVKSDMEAGTPNPFLIE